MELYVCTVTSMSESWTSWSGEQTCTPAARRRVRSVADVQEAVAAATAAGQDVRVAGSGHSFSPLCRTDGMLITLDGLRGLRSVDRATNRVVVEAGTVLHDLGQLLRAEGLSQDNLGDIDVQTLAG